MNEFRGDDQSHEALMRLYFRSLPENHRRRYAVVKALKIGFCSIAYVARELGMSRRMIYTGIRELEAMGNDDHHSLQHPSGDAKRIRSPGSGRRQVTQCQRSGALDRPQARAVSAAGACAWVSN